MGAHQSKVNISIPKTRCFPAYNNEAELLETVRQIEICHVQALKMASWVGSMVGTPCNPVGHVAVSAATILLTFLLHRLTTDLSKTTSDVSSKNINGCHQQQRSPSITLEDALIDSKVTAAIAKKSVCELQAKLCIISNRHQRLLSDISLEDRRLEVVPAIQTCEEVLQLFHDPTHVFRLNPLVTAPFLASFAGIFLAISELSLALIPSHRGPLVGEMNLLRETLVTYKNECTQVRMLRIKFRTVQPGSMLEVVAGGMQEMNYKMDDPFVNRSKRDQNNNEKTSTDVDTDDEIERIYHTANEATMAYKKNLEKEYEIFFKPALESVSKFTGFEASQHKNLPGCSNGSCDNDVYSIIESSEYEDAYIFHSA